jgi:hypothetical protein
MGVLRPHHAPRLNSEAPSLTSGKLRTTGFAKECELPAPTGSPVVDAWRTALDLGIGDMKPAARGAKRRGTREYTRNST